MSNTLGVAIFCIGAFFLLMHFYFLSCLAYAWYVKKEKKTGSTAPLFGSIILSLSLIFLQNQVMRIIAIIAIALDVGTFLFGLIQYKMKKQA